MLWAGAFLLAAPAFTTGNKKWKNKLIQKYRCHRFRNTDVVDSEIQMSWIQKYRCHRFRNTDVMDSEIQMSRIQKHKGHGLKNTDFTDQNPTY